MNLERQTATCRSADLLVEELDGELVVYDLRTHDAHHLASTVAAVWRACDGRKEIAEIARSVRGPAGDLNLETVWLALRELRDAGLLEERIDLPGEVRTLSRRALLARAAAVGAGAGVAVLTVSVRPAAAAGSCTSTVGAPCNNNNDCCLPLTCQGTNPNKHCQ